MRKKSLSHKWSVKVMTKPIYKNKRTLVSKIHCLCVCLWILNFHNFWVHNYSDNTLTQYWCRGFPILSWHSHHVTSFLPITCCQLHRVTGCQPITVLIYSVRRSSTVSSWTDDGRSSKQWSDQSWRALKWNANQRWLMDGLDNFCTAEFLYGRQVNMFLQSLLFIPILSSWNIS